MHLQVIWDQDVTSIYPEPLTGNLHITYALPQWSASLAQIWVRFPGREKWSKYGFFYFGESDPYVVSLSLLSHHCSCSDTNFSWSSEKTFNFFTQAYCRSSVDQCLSFPIYRVTGSALTHLLLDHLSNYSCPSFTHDIRRFDVFVCCCSWRRVG